MRLSTRSRYGTRLVLDIAAFGRHRPVPLKDVARRQKISVKYLEQLSRKLKIAGLLTSRRGPLGGHMLAREPDKISIGDIVRTLEGSDAIVQCALGSSQSCDACDRLGDCLTRWVWMEAAKAFFKRIDQITIAFLLSLNGH